MELDEKFWREFNATTDYNDFLVSIATRIVTGEDLSNIDKDKLFKLIFNMAFTNGTTESEFKIRIKKFKQSIPNFLSTVDSVLTDVQKHGIEMYKMQTNLIDRVKTLPPLADTFDPEVVLKFIRSLDKKHYSFSEAEKLLGVTRQTLRSYVDQGKYGLKVIQEKKSEYLTRESIVNFYRDRYFKDQIVL